MATARVRQAPHQLTHLSGLVIERGTVLIAIMTIVALHDLISSANMLLEMKTGVAPDLAMTLVAPQNMATNEIGMKSRVDVTMKIVDMIETGTETETEKETETGIEIGIDTVTEMTGIETTVTVMTVAVKTAIETIVTETTVIAERTATEIATATWTTNLRMSVAPKPLDDWTSFVALAMTKIREPVTMKL